MFLIYYVLSAVNRMVLWKLMYFDTSMIYDEWWIVFTVQLTDERQVSLFLAWILVRDTQRCDSPTIRGQDMNLRRTCTCINIFMLVCVTSFIVKYQYLLINPCVLMEFFWKCLYWQTTINDIMNLRCDWKDKISVTNW